jgi:hypothetical protein
LFRIPEGGREGGEKEEKGLAGVAATVGLWSGAGAKAAAAALVLASALSAIALLPAVAVAWAALV